MRLDELRQVELRELLGQHADAIIAASACESRDTYLAGYLRDVQSDRRIALSYVDDQHEDAQSNDWQFTNLGYMLHPSDGENPEMVRLLVEEAVRSAKGPTASLIVDYSCMSSTWYAAILDFLAAEPLGLERVDVYFAYSPAGFPEHPSPVSHISMGPISGHWHMQLPDRQTALVVDLGCDPERALGLVEYLDPAEVYVLYASHFPDAAYIDAVVENNSALIERAGPGRMIAYPFNNLQATVEVLSSLCEELNKDYRVIVAPLGPRPLLLLSLLQSIRLPIFDVWRVITSSPEMPLDRSPLGQVLVYKASFVG